MKVSNPLTIIAIFSGVAETLATVALVKLPPEIQSIFVYFVMAFPTSIVLLFFYVLYFKNNVLYAPSDFEDQTHYLESNNVKEKVNSEIEKIFFELNAKGASLTRQEIDKLKNNVAATIDKESLAPELAKILAFLEKRASSTQSISTLLRVSSEKALLKLKYLEDMKLIRFNSEHKWQVLT